MLAHNADFPSSVRAPGRRALRPAAVGLRPVPAAPTTQPSPAGRRAPKERGESCSWEGEAFYSYIVVGFLTGSTECGLTPLFSWGSSGRNLSQQYGSASNARPTTHRDRWTADAGDRKSVVKGKSVSVRVDL